MKYRATAAAWFSTFAKRLLNRVVQAYRLVVTEAVGVLAASFSVCAASAAVNVVEMASDVAQNKRRWSIGHHLS